MKVGFCLIIAVVTLFVIDILVRKPLTRVESFDEKHVLITGASSGLGQALAIKLAAQGANCVLIAIDNDGLVNTQNQCKNPENHALIEADLSKAEDVERVIQTVKGQEFEFSALCAGLGSTGISAPTGKVFTLFSLNCSACAALATAVRAKKTLFMASPQAFLPLPNRAFYAASKAACLELARCLIEDGIDCMVAMPMWFASNLRANAIGNTQQERKTAKGAKTAGDVADEIIAGAMSGKREVCLDFKQRVGRLCYTFFPGLVEFMVSRFVSGNE